MHPLIEMSISTPALVVPAITILILTYSNRFTTLSNRIREFVKKEGQVNNQIDIFYTRIGYVQKMLFFWGIRSCVVSIQYVLCYAYIEYYCILFDGNFISYDIHIIG